MAEDRRQLAVDQLVSVCGTDETRAARIVDALAAIGAEEALATLVEDDAIEASLPEQRLRRLRRLTETIDGLLSDREVAAIFAVPATTGRSLNRQLQARFPKLVQGRISKLIASGTVTQEEGSEEGEIRIAIAYDDETSFALALDRLRSRGMTRGLVVDRARQKLIVPPKMLDRSGKRFDPRKVLGV